jgi:hypothetical protein
LTCSVSPTAFLIGPTWGAQNQTMRRKGSKIQLSLGWQFSVVISSPEFINSVEAIAGVTYLVAVSKDTHCWLKQSLTITRSYRWAGQTKSKTAVADSACKSVCIADLAANINDYFWYRRKVCEGANGPIIYEFARRHVILADNGIPKKNVCMMIRRTVGDDPEDSYFITNASASTTTYWHV